MIRNIYPALFILAAATATEAQTWQTDFNQPTSFIENKGQFDARTGMEPGKVLYAMDGGSSMTLFHATGITFYAEQKPKNPDRLRGQREKPRRHTERTWIGMEWEGADPDVEVVAEAMTPDRHAYAMRGQAREWTTMEGMRSYARLVYKGLYPGIDVTYEPHAHGGHKYTVTVHPGADPSLVCMRYADGALVRLDAQGNVRVATPYGDIIDHAPFTFLDQNRRAAVRSAFVIEGNVVRFNLGTYDASRTLTIDPWTTSPAFGNSNKAWDIETDAANNVYVYGGDTPMRLRKYNSTGALQWTYNTPYDTANYWLGTLLTDPAGNSYITASTDPVIAKISTTMGVTWSNTGGAFDEYWRLAFNCDRTKLMLGGTRLTLGAGLSPIGYGRAFDMNMNNGAQISSINVAAWSPGFLGINNADEIRALCSSPNGKYYYMTLDTIGELNQNMTHGWRTDNGYGFSYGVAGYGATNLGINAIVASSDFLYTHNGSTLHKRNINNGSIIATATIPGGVTQSQLGYNSVMNGGLILDDCGNLYVGSGSSVVKFNGTTLQQMGTASVSGAVYDVAFNGNEIVACGNGFVASVSGLSPCAVPEAECLDCLELEDAGPFCHTDAAVTLVNNMPGGTWSGPGITSGSTGTFNPATAGPGTHTITYTPPTAPPCGQNTISIVVNNCADITVCTNANGTVTASGGVGSYTWQSQSTALDCSGCPFGNCFPPICNGVNVTTWTTFATTATATPPGTFPIRVQDGAGNELVITSTAGLPACQACAMTAQVSAQENVSCFGGSNGSATVSANGGTGTTTYSWAPGNLSGAAQTDLAAGVYTVTATSDGCTASTTVTISEPASLPSASLNEVVQPGCGQSNGSITLQVSGGTAGYSYSWDPSGGNQVTASGLAAGSYTCTVTDANGCETSFTQALNNPNAPTAQISQSTDVSCAGDTDGTATVSATGGSGGYTYLWDNSQASVTATGLAPGDHTCTVTDQSGCAVTVTVTTDEPLTLTATATDATTPCGQNSGSVTVTPDGGTSPYDYAWDTSPAQNTATVTGLGGGLYTVTVTDENGCTTTATSTVTNTGGPTVNVTSVQNASCYGSTGSATLAASGGGSPYTYEWGTQPAQTGPTLTAHAGTYAYTVTNNLGCVTAGEVTITEPTALWPNATAQDVTCKGDEDGSLSAAPNGGTPPYSYSWSNGPTTANQNSVSGGSYTVTVTDANGCQHDTTMIIGFQYDFDISITVNGNTITSSGGGINYVWYLEGNPIPGANGPTYTMTQSGNYYVSATDANGCEGASNIIEATYIGIAESVLGNVSYLYDAEGVVIRSSVPTKQAVQWQLVDASGRRIMEGTLPKGQTDLRLTLSWLASGAYSLNLRTDGTNEALKVMWVR